MSYYYPCSRVFFSHSRYERYCDWQRRPKIRNAYRHAWHTELVTTPRLFRKARHTYAFVSSVWRHWGCVTPKIIENVKKKFEDASELDGFEDLREPDRARVVKAWQEGHVADEDIPESARKPEGEEDKPEKAPRKASRKKADQSDGEDAEEEKPKKSRARSSKVSY